MSEKNLEGMINISLEKVKEESTPSPQCINIDLYNALNSLDENFIVESIEKKQKEKNLLI